MLARSRAVPPRSRAKFAGPAVSLLLTHLGVCGRGLSLGDAPWRHGLGQVGDSFPETHCVFSTGGGWLASGQWLVSVVGGGCSELVGVVDDGQDGNGIKLRQENRIPPGNRTNPDWPIQSRLLALTLGAILWGCRPEH